MEGVNAVVKQVPNPLAPNDKINIHLFVRTAKGFARALRLCACAYGRTVISDYTRATEYVYRVPALKPILGRRAVPDVVL